MARKPHPKAEVEAALRHAEARGWATRMGGAHAWQATPTGRRQLCV